MKYKKPMVVDLGAGAMGQNTPNSCYSGPTPGPNWYLCETGGDPYSPAQGCAVGPTPGSGSTVMCISGAAPLSICESGSGGWHDDYCTAGPSAGT